MKKNIAPGILCVLIIVLIFALTVPAFAQEIEEAANFNQEAASEKALEMLKEKEPGILIDLVEHAKEPLDFGQAHYHTLWIPANDFTPDWGSGRTFYSSGYYYKDGGSTWYAATVNLPSGAKIGRVAFYSYDNTNIADYNFYWSLVRHNTATDTSTTLISHSTFAAPGYNITWVDPAALYFENRNQYVIWLNIPNQPAYIPDLSWKGVRILYARIISPKPSTATFPDVPTTHGFHQHIEALAASGITSGFSDGTFRPNDFVTRGQMAVFLSRALGLHHPDVW